MNSNKIIQSISNIPTGISDFVGDAKACIEALRSLPHEKAEQLSKEVKDLTLLTVDAVGSTIAAMIACD